MMPTSMPQGMMPPGFRPGMPPVPGMHSMPGAQGANPMAMMPPGGAPGFPPPHLPHHPSMMTPVGPPGGLPQFPVGFRPPPVPGMPPMPPGMPG